MPRLERLAESLPDRQPPATALPRYLCIAYVLLVTYASLHPFSGWRDPGLPVLTFLQAPWPRYWTVFDLVVNVLAYLPLGFLLTLTLRGISGRWLAAFASLLLGVLLSFTLESIQTWLPSRVASNVDLACNSLGCGLGVLALGIVSTTPFARRSAARAAAQFEPAPRVLEDVDLGRP